MTYRSPATPLPDPIPLVEYAKRRKALFARMAPNSIAILPAATVVSRNGDNEYPFRQDSDFYYLTGFLESDAILVLLKESERVLLFSLPDDPKSARWLGHRMGNSVLEKGIQECHPLDQWPVLLPELLLNRQLIYYSFGIHMAIDKQVIKALNKVRQKQRYALYPAEGFLEVKQVIAEERIRKSPAELELMAYAGRVSGNAHQTVMQNCQPDKMEYQLEAIFTAECMDAGCRAMAYSPIVASGKNACILHYHQNGDPLKAGELLLVDAGAEYANYAADITRTYPINGRFTPEQKALYEVVLEAQTNALALIKPGLPWNHIQNVIVETLIQGLLSLKVIKGSLDEWISTKKYHQFYMHGSGHWLGLDVHDVGAYTVVGTPVALEPNMVLTVEPGIYISEDCTDIDQRWHGIGIRIEDDIVVADGGHFCLTPDAPKKVADIEACMRIRMDAADKPRHVER